MAPDEPLESRHVSQVGYSDLNGRPAFKIAVTEVNGSWYLYLAHFWHSGWTIVDVTDPHDPEVVRFIEGPENTMTLQVQVADGLMITSLERPRENWGPIDGPTMDPDQPFRAGVYLWDIDTDPTDPELLHHWDSGGGGTHRNHYDGGEYLYATSKPPGFDGAMLQILDVSEPADPSVAGEWWYPGQAPDEESTERFYFHGPAYPDRHEVRAYLSYGAAGMVELDISEKSDPTLSSHVDFGDLGSWLGVHSAVPVPEADIVVTNSEAILESPPTRGGEPLNFTFLIDVSERGELRYDGLTPRGPKVVSSLPQPRPSDAVPFATYHDRAGRFGPHNQHHYQYQEEHLKTDDILPMTYFNAGLRLFDISDVLQPEEVGYFLPQDPAQAVNDQRPGTGLVSQLEDVLVDSRGFIYCTDPNHGLFILESSLI